MSLSPCSRRQFLATALAAGLFTVTARAEDARPRRVLVRSAWQTVNIGDIGHTPGILHLLEEYLPEVEVWLWPRDIGAGVEELLRARFPKVRIVQAKADVDAAFAGCDFFLHGSSSGFSAQKDVARWHTETGKPYGIYGITLTQITPEATDLIDGARFIYFRDGESLAWAKHEGFTCPLMAYGPDAAFAVDLRNDAAAEAFLRANALEEGKFLCVIPRLRFTPYWKIRNKPMTAEDEIKNARNEQMKEHDHAPLRAAIAAVVRETPLKVLVCPEDRSQMEIGKAMLVDPLPEEVKKRVVWREQYWLTDEAISTYVRSAGLFGLEMHSPIMCIGNGVPAIVCRFAEQTNKGLMWRDIGLGDWLFDMDQPEEVARLTATVLSLAQDPAAAHAKAAQARRLVQGLQRESMGVLRKDLQA
jgi:hypothetical protein